MRTALLQPHYFTAQPLLSFLNPHQFARTTHYLGWNNSRSPHRIRINLEDELYDYADGDDDFRFAGASKQRVWWSNDESSNWFDDDEEEEEEEEDEFWIFKVFRAFGWMVPAIGISLLLGTGTNAFFMALAVPLGQTALSLVIDKVWGSTSRRSKPRCRTGPRTRTRSRKKPFTRPARREETSNSKEDTTREKEGCYESWMASAGSFRKKSGKRVHPFGGWDELDEWHKVPRGTAKEEVDELPKQQNKSKLSRARRVRDTPMFLRLLVAVFPFLGSWSRFLFRFKSIPYP